MSGTEDFDINSDDIEDGLQAVKLEAHPLVWDNKMNQKQFTDTYADRLTRLFDRDEDISRSTEQKVQDFLRLVWEQASEVPWNPTINVTVVNVTNSPNTTVNVNPAPKKPKSIPWQKRQRFNFAFMNGPDTHHLSIKDRVVFSYLRTLTKLERKGKRLKFSVNRIRRKTGYRHAIVSQSLRTLIAGGFISDSWRVLRDFRAQVVARDHSDRTMVLAICEINHKRGRIVGASWCKKAFGISRPTYYRWMKAGTDETLCGNG